MQRISVQFPAPYGGSQPFVLWRRSQTPFLAYASIQHAHGTHIHPAHGNTFMQNTPTHYFFKLNKSSSCSIRSKYNPTCICQSYLCQPRMKKTLIIIQKPIKNKRNIQLYYQGLFGDSLWLCQASTRKPPNISTITAATPILMRLPMT